jgi:hypothetical protein
VQRSLYRIDGPDFTSELESETKGDVERVVRASPLMTWTVGKPVGDVLGYCIRKGWEINRPARDYPEQ